MTSSTTEKYHDFFWYLDSFQQIRHNNNNIQRGNAARFGGYFPVVDICDD